MFKAIMLTMFTSKYAEIENMWLMISREVAILCSSPYRKLWDMFGLNITSHNHYRLHGEHARGTSIWEVFSATVK